MTSAKLICGVLLILAAHVVPAQDLPPKLRGYKVHKTNVVVCAADSADAKDADVLVKLGEPKLKSLGITGTTIEIAAEITSLDKSGSVELLTFHDFTVNGVAVEIGDQAQSFTFERNVSVTLQPATVTIGPIGSARAALRELTDGKTDWRVAGTVFVFGKFKRFGFTFKRVIPVRIDLTIANPLRK